MYICIYIDYIHTYACREICRYIYTYIYIEWIYRHVDIWIYVYIYIYLCVYMLYIARERYIDIEIRYIGRYRYIYSQLTAKEAEAQRLLMRSAPHPLPGVAPSPPDKAGIVESILMMSCEPGHVGLLCNIERDIWIYIYICTYIFVYL